MELGPYEGNNKHFTKFRYPHTSSWDFEVENNLDPDDGNSLLCGACRLPVFSTPFITTDVDNITLHDQCAHLPEKLEGHVLHPAQALLRHTNQPTSTTISCSRCRSICGTTFYKCGDPQCKIQLDASCALTVKILHRSHEHRLTAVRGTSFSFICAVCGTQHKRLNVSPRSRRKSWDITSYMCSFCDFWIHPDCALLPNAIFLLHPFHRHQHPLLLTYDLGFSDGPPFAVSKCEICGAWLDCLVIYFCGMCRYRAHVKCVMEAPRSLGLISDSSSFFKRGIIY